MGARWSARSTVKMEEGLGFGLGKPKKSGKVKDESRFRESEPEQPDARSKGKERCQRPKCLWGGHGMQAGLQQVSEQTRNLGESTICKDRESNDFRDGAGGPEF